MTTVRVKYHREPEGWWAESPDIDGFVASGTSLHEVRELTREGLPFYLDGAEFDLVEEGPASAVVVDWSVQAAAMAQAVTSSMAPNVKVRGMPGVGADLGQRSVAGVT